MPDVSQLPLRDIHLPGPVSWWPPAPGWWLLVALLLAAAAVGVMLHYRARHRRAALAAVAQVSAALEQGAEPVGCLQQLSTIMRRYAITLAEKRAEVAGLTGERWLRYLDSRSERAAFTTDSGRLLASAPYARPASVPRQAAADLAVLCAAWIQAQPIGGASRRRPFPRWSLPRRLAPRSAA